MEQFSLDKYLENPSRKVVTRSGHNVRILCTDQRGNMPIVALVEFETLDGVQIFYSDGKNESHREYDLFFADNEELTEFEKVVQSILNEPHFQDIEAVKQFSNNLLNLARKEIQPEFDKEMGKHLAETDKYNRDSIIALIQWSESFNSSGMTHDKANQLITWVNSYNPYDIWCHKDSKTFNPTQNQAEFEKGRTNALKDLPKWKKAKKDEELDCHVAIQQDDRVVLSDFVQKDEYYITLDVLKKLPKEE